MPVCTIRVSSSLAKKLEKLVKTTGRTKTFFFTKALEERLDVYERVYQPLIPVPKRNISKIKKAIARGNQLRFTKPEGMTLKEMQEEGRANYFEKTSSIELAATSFSAH